MRWIMAVLLTCLYGCGNTTDGPLEFIGSQEGDYKLSPTVETPFPLTVTYGDNEVGYARLTGAEIHDLQWSHHFAEVDDNGETGVQLESKINLTISSRTDAAMAYTLFATGTVASGPHKSGNACDPYRGTIRELDKSGPQEIYFCDVTFPRDLGPDSLGSKYAFLNTDGLSGSISADGTEVNIPDFFHWDIFAITEVTMGVQLFKPQ